MAEHRSLPGGGGATVVLALESRTRCHVSNIHMFPQTPCLLVTLPTFPTLEGFVTGGMDVLLVMDQCELRLELGRADGTFDWLLVRVDLGVVLQQIVVEESLPTLIAGVDLCLVPNLMSEE